MAVVNTLAEPLTVGETDVPSPGPGQALVKRYLPGSATRTCMRPRGTGR